MKFTSKQLNAIKNCKTAEEIVAKANENGFEISSEEAGKLLSDGGVALSDESLAGIAGGIEKKKPSDDDNSDSGC